MRARVPTVFAVFACAVIRINSAAIAGALAEPHAWHPCSFSDGALSRSDCVKRDKNGSLGINPALLQSLDFDSVGLAVINSEGTFYYVRRDGRLAPTMLYDNFADPFVNGRARSPLNGKIGYIDQQLTMIIPATYDGAYVFDHGYAVVCMGCTLKSGGVGEYHWYEGGKWGCIDRFGREQSPLRPLKHDEPNNSVCSGFRR